MMPPQGLMGHLSMTACTPVSSFEFTECMAVTADIEKAFLMVSVMEGCPTLSMG